ncbi:MAG: hypothetical protein AUJ52_00940 [Elusimicrobia bacterium CG1_02_63_36]|nr:MAG: hypothetical protein AUJ52_00940 [Elusimicrobia bacterium CG1_02_63_36]PIP84394.1 MAG: hypothetical protein COR54_04310 [Elusimicrobia bacterium CG22_combo_CG10-13_8_21_14_all_63_91]PJA18647.1 MAG: hypothetical protein COX66_00580 [Elusimicrobia bacterium CG_4_10_14_0_2_um_filter_63_34]PJB23391.1 MAG: hypothetical protein CO113_18295 [Elusimicrobia bacterium CG_4_9_14_3_um_filter_62_55]
MRTKSLIIAALCAVAVGCANRASEGKKLPLELAQMAKNGTLPYAQKETSAAAGAAVDPVKAALEQSLKEPYANDFGPESVSIAGYPAKEQEGYKNFLAKCTQCHSAARPLNAQYIDDNAATTDKWVSHHESGVWKRFVKRMMAKPGCAVTPEEAGGIVAFLVHDSKVRKTGANAAAWKARRKKLLADFKKKHPKRYTLLYGN